MAIGGFNNNGGEVLLSTFEKYVKAGLVHYYIVGNGTGGGAPGGGAGPGSGTGSTSSASSISSWVSSHFRSETIGGETVYNLTEPMTD